MDARLDCFASSFSDLIQLIDSGSAESWIGFLTGLYLLQHESWQWSQAVDRHVTAYSGIDGYANYGYFSDFVFYYCYGPLSVDTHASGL